MNAQEKVGWPWSPEEIFEVFIRHHVRHDKRLLDAMAEVIGRAPSPEDYSTFEAKVDLMHNGWVTINGNIRKLGKAQPKKEGG